MMADETINKNSVEDMRVCIRFVDVKFEAIIIIIIII